MLSLTHTLISVPIGLYIHNPVLAFIVACAVHFLADMLLHWNIYPRDFKRFPFGLIALDVLGGLAAAGVMLHREVLQPSVLAAILGGNFPDILQMLWELTPMTLRERPALAWTKPYFVFHEKIQRETPRIAVGLVSQAVLLFAAAILVGLH